MFLFSFPTLNISYTFYQTEVRKKDRKSPFQTVLKPWDKISSMTYKKRNIFTSFVKYKQEKTFRNVRREKLLFSPDTTHSCSYPELQCNLSRKYYMKYYNIYTNFTGFYCRINIKINISKIRQAVILFIFQHRLMIFPKFKYILPNN